MKQIEDITKKGMKYTECALTTLLVADLLKEMNKYVRNDLRKENPSLTKKATTVNVF